MTQRSKANRRRRQKQRLASLDMPVTPEWDKCEQAPSLGREVKVDRKDMVLRGYVIAQEGEFKSQGRGRYDKKSIEMHEVLANGDGTEPDDMSSMSVSQRKLNAKGIKARWTHPGLSADAMGNQLGRTRDAWIDKTDENQWKLRGDLHFNEVSQRPGPNGGSSRAKFIMDLAEEDPGALSSSVVAKHDYFALDKTGAMVEYDENRHRDQIPLWRPRGLHASDIVETGDAVDDLLSLPEGLTDDHVRQGFTLLDQVFSGQDREVVESRLGSFADRYLSNRFGDCTPADSLSDDEEDDDMADALTKDDLAAANKPVTDALTAGFAALGELLTQQHTESQARQERKDADDKLRQEAAEISALCERAGSDKGAAWIAEGLSLTDVRKNLFDQMLAARELQSEDGSDSSGGKQKLTESSARKAYVAGGFKDLGFTFEEYFGLAQEEDAGGGGVEFTPSKPGSDPLV